MNYRKIPEMVKALTFGELLLHGARECEKAGQALGPNGMPRVFTYAGHTLTHETDDSYCVETPGGEVSMFNRGDLLVLNDRGEVYPVRGELFRANYELAGA